MSGVRLREPSRAQRLLRLSRSVLDASATPYLALQGVVVLYLLMFDVTFAAQDVIIWGLRVGGLSRQAAQFAYVVGDTRMSLGSLLDQTLLVLAATASVVVVLGWARLGRAWALWIVLLGSFTLWLVNLGQGGELTSLTRRLMAMIETLAHWGAVAGAVLGLLGGFLAGRSALERIARRWPRLSVAIYATRYGIARPSFWTGVVLRLVGVIATVVALGLVCDAIIFGLVIAPMPLLAQAGAPPQALRVENPMLCLTAVLFALLAVVSARSAWRNSAARWANLVVLGLCLVAVWEMGAVIAAWLSSGSRAFANPFDYEELWFLASTALVWLLRGFIFAAAIRGYRGLQQATARTARELTAKRREPPILFLRSFDDDEQQVPSSDVMLAYAFGAARPSVRLEELVARTMFAKGPLVALANPRVKAAPIGAARDVVEDANWQATVLDYLAASQIVVCFFGHTSSFMWEIDRILEQDKLGHTLIVFPPDYTKSRTIFEHAPSLAELLGLTGPEDERVRFAHLRALVLDARTGEMEALLDPRADSFAYEQAIMLAAAQVQLNREARAGPSLGDR